MASTGQFRDFLHQAHIFASTVHEILEEKCLRESTDLEISVSQLTLLQLIAHNGDHQLGEIASFFGVSPAAASKTVDKLVRMGLVERSVNAVDRRALSLSVTSGGRKLIRAYEGKKKKKVARVFSQIPEDEVMGLARGLERVCYSILKEEGDFGDICLKCSALYQPQCMIRDLHDGCVYARKRGGAPP